MRNHCHSWALIICAIFPQVLQYDLYFFFITFVHQIGMSRLAIYCMPVILCDSLACLAAKEMVLVEVSRASREPVHLCGRAERGHRGREDSSSEQALFDMSAVRSMNSTGSLIALASLVGA